MAIKQMYEQVKEKIKHGVAAYRSGMIQELSSENRYAAMLHVSRMMVCKTVEKLITTNLKMGGR